MASRFIGKSSLAGLRPLLVGAQPVLALHGLLREAVSARAGPAAAALFATPIVTWPTAGQEGSVSWYADAAGDSEALASLPNERRAPAEARLRDILGRLTPLLNDPQIGPLLRLALALGTPDGLLSVGGTPVLTNWGLVPDGPEPVDAAATLAAAWTGAYAAVPRLELPEAPPSLEPGSPPPAAPARRPTPIIPPGRSAWDWGLIPATVLIAAAFLGIGVFAGVRMVANRITERPTAVALLNEQASREAIDRQREQNVALEREIEARRGLLAGNVCVADPALVPRLGPDRAAIVPSTAVVPPPPGGQPFQGSLAELLTQAVVLVIASSEEPGGGISTGTGFFVAPDLIATNRHVVEGADPARILVTSRKLGRTTRAEVVAQTPNSEIGSPDIALLRVQGITGVQPLAFSTTAAPLDQVIAAGFPGLLMQSDEAFARLRQGDASAMPEVILTDGRVSAIQSAPGGMRIIPHTAAVSGGNSGGPLADACGRVIGINTFITANREQVAHANYAQKSDGVVAFLRRSGTNVADLTGPCAPAATPAAVPAAAPR